MQGGQVELFRRAREFLSNQGMARNVRIVDVVSVLSAPLTGTINANQRLDANYNDEGSFQGPLNGDGNMPTSSMGVIIGSAIMMPRLWVATEEPETEQAWQQLTQNTNHMVRVAGTDVIQRHASFSGKYSGLGTGIAAGPLYGPPDSNRHMERTPEPTLVVGGGERAQQALFVRRGIALGVVTVTPELLLNMVVADEGSD
jgi:hypothetical protein